jgi:transcriptional antiterminator RfaH
MLTERYEMQRWYVVNSQPAAEPKATWHLRNQGYEVYLPRYLKKTRHARRTMILPKPLFPNYLFVSMDLTVTRWRANRSTIGVVGLVCAGERPAPVPVGVVEQIRMFEDESGMILPPKPECFTKGQKVEIADGAFDGLVGLVDGMSDRERVILLLNLLGREVRIQLPVEMVRAVA